MVAVSRLEQVKMWALSVAISLAIVAGMVSAVIALGAW